MDNATGRNLEDWESSIGPPPGKDEAMLQIRVLHGRMLRLMKGLEKHFPVDTGLMGALRRSFERDIETLESFIQQ